MAKRTLPLRASRGQLPSYLREPPSPLKRERTVSRPQPQEAQRKEIENKRKSQQIANLRKYPFGRAVHYFFELDTFPRAEGHISYAIDVNNALNNTFSKDHSKLGSGSFGEVLNRKLFGLPGGSGENITLRKENRCKNVASSYLYENEDKKYQMDRVLCTLKVVLKRLNAGASLLQLAKFDVLKKDAELSLVLEEGPTLAEKTEVITEKLETLQTRKEANSANWLVEDKTYFYHSLNQKLHNAINDLKKQLSDEALLTILYQAGFQRQQAYKFEVKYYHKGIQCLSLPVSALKSTVPACMFFFEGSTKTFKLATQIIAKKCEGLGETTFYEAKQMIRNLFGMDMVLKPDRFQSYAHYSKGFRRKCQEIRKNTNQLQQRSRKYPLCDQFVRDEQLSIGPRTKISGRQYIMVVIFYWLCLGLDTLAPLLETFPDLVTYISSDYFPKVYSWLVSATGSPLVGMMCAAIEGLSDLFSKPDLLSNFPIQLLFQFDPLTGLGLLLRQEIESETQPSARTSVGLEEERSQPVKKVKRDNN